MWQCSLLTVGWKKPGTGDKASGSEAENPELPPVTQSLLLKPKPAHFQAPTKGSFQHTLGASMEAIGSGEDTGLPWATPTLEQAGNSSRQDAVAGLPVFQLSYPPHAPLPPKQAPTSITSLPD